MNLVEIEHSRCNETVWGEITYLYAPDDWTEDDIWEHARNAQKTYLKYLEEFSQMEPPEKIPSYRINAEFYERYPDLTISEIQEIYKQKRQEYEEWDEKRREILYPFSHFLREEGFLYISEMPKFHVHLDWGHRHGMDIDYGALQSEDVKVRGVKTIRTI